MNNTTHHLITFAKSASGELRVTPSALRVRRGDIVHWGNDSPTDNYAVVFHGASPFAVAGVAGRGFARNPQTVQGPDGSYKYTILVAHSDGTYTLLDPEIICDGSEAN